MDLAPPTAPDRVVLEVTPDGWTWYSFVNDQQQGARTTRRTGDKTFVDEVGSLSRSLRAAIDDQHPEDISQVLAEVVRAREAA